MNILIDLQKGPGASERPVEIVERKGLGHPDTICDMLSEQLSVALSKHYLDHFGLVLHHNVDKALLVAGRSEPAFGGGHILEPIDIFLSGRATHDVHGKVVPVRELAEETATYDRALFLGILCNVLHGQAAPQVMAKLGGLHAGLVQAPRFLRGAARAAGRRGRGFRPPHLSAGGSRGERSTCLNRGLRRHLASPSRAAQEMRSTSFSLGNPLLGATLTSSYRGSRRAGRAQDHPTRG